MKEDRDNVIKAKEALELAEPGHSPFSHHCMCNIGQCVCVHVLVICIV